MTSTTGQQLDVGVLNALLEGEYASLRAQPRGTCQPCSKEPNGTTRAVDTLCRDLRPHAVTLVNAFGVPDELLTQEI